MLPAGRRPPLTISRPCALGGALLAACLVASCSHGQGLLGKAESSFRERDYDDALSRYRKLAGEECSPEGSSRLCCAGLLGEAESLLAISERQAALKAFEHCRQECPTNPDVRRKQFLAEHATDPEPEGVPATVTFTVEHVLTGLSERARIIWVGLFLDGEVVGREPLSVRPGSHDLEAEALLQAPGGKGVDSRPVHLRARQPVNASARGGVLTPHARVTLGERADASLPEDRTTLELAVSGAPPVREQPSPRPAGLGIELRVSGSNPKFPAEFVQRGSGWRVRTEICVAPDGRVQSIQFVDTAPAHDPVVDATILETVRRWHYGAYKVDGVLHGFCHLHEVDLAR